MEIEGHPDYLIHRDGRVWSKKGKGRFLKPYPNPDGYLLVALYKDCKRNHMKVHRLLGKAYIPNPENKPQIDHIDRNTQNNNIENLRWATKSENQRNKTVSGAVPFKGVSEKGNRFRARIRIDGKLKYLGLYDTPEEASEAYIQYCTDNNINIY